MATLTVTRILADIAAAITVHAPLMRRVASNFTAEPLKLNQTAIAHISKLPTVQPYDAAAGYGKDALETNTLVEDRPITIDQHKHVPIKVSYLESIKDNKQTYRDAIRNAGLVLGKAIVDDGLSKILAANFSGNTIEALVDVDRDTLGKMRTSMNKKGAMSEGRTAMVNSDVFEALDADPRIASRDYHDQRSEGQALGLLRNVAGFEEVLEYPDFPGNTENLVGFGMDPRAMAVMTGLPADIEEIRHGAGAPSIANFEVVTDPDTGLSLLGIFWQQPGTFQVFMTVTCLWGWSVGKGGGAAGAVTDYAGHRLITA